MALDESIGMGGLGVERGGWMTAISRRSVDPQCVQVS